MKMFTFIIILIAGCLAVSHARANADSSKQEPFIIQTTAAGEALWALRQSYQQTELKYKGSKMEAYYCNPENLIGFGKKLTVLDLPQQVIKKIKHRFQNFNIVNAMLFINANGNIYYYAGLENTHELIGVKVSSKCRVSVLQKISHN